MAEEARDPARDVPRSIGLVAAAVFAIYAFLPAVALSAMPMHETPALSHPPGHRAAPTTGRRWARSTRATRCRASSRTSASAPLTTPVSYYVGLLAGTILIIATNAGLIGVSRLTYSMGVHRQFPDFLRTVHPTWRTPWVAIVVYTFAAIGMIERRQARGRPGRRVPRQPLRVRRDALVHDRARLGDRAARAQVQARSRAAVPRAAQHAHRRARHPALRRARRPRHVRGVHRRRGALPGRALGRPRLARARHGRLRRLPQAPGAAAHEDRLRRHQGARARDRDRVPHDRAARDGCARRRRDDRDRAAARLGAARARRRRLHARGARRARRSRRSRRRTRRAPTSSWPRPRRSGSSTACR